MDRPWEKHQATAHSQAVTAAKSALREVLDAEGWISILPDVSENTFKLLTSITGKLEGVIRAIDRPTVLEDFDKEGETDAVMAEFMVEPVVAAAEKEAKVFHFDEMGEITDDDTAGPEATPFA
jgi:hypothetical protein